MAAHISVCTFPSPTAGNSVEEDTSVPLDYYNKFHNCRSYYKEVRRTVAAVVNTVNNLQSDLFVKGFCPVPNVIERSKGHMLELNYVYRELAETRYNFPRQYFNYEGGLLEQRLRTVGIVAFLHWLETGKLISMKEVDTKLGLRGPMISEEEGALGFARALAKDQGKTITGKETLENKGVKQETGADGFISFSIEQNPGTQKEEDSEEEDVEESSDEEDGDKGEDAKESSGEEKDDKTILGKLLFRGFELDIEDYLIGICGMTEKMPEYVSHQVMLGDYGCPKKVLKLLSDIIAVIRPLNPHVMFPTVDKNLIGVFRVAEKNLIRVEELCFDAEVLLRKKLDGSDNKGSK